MVAENFLMSNMPKNVEHLWESSSDEFKAEVKTQATQREFLNESQVVRFWVSRFTDSVLENINKRKVEQGSMISENQSSSLVRFTKMLNGANF